MAGAIFDTAMLAHLASLVSLIGFMIRDQLLLRGLIAVGTVFYIAFYYLHPPQPIWVSIFWNAAFGIINVVMISVIVWERTSLRLDENEQRLFAELNLFSPGEFRRLIRIAEPFACEADKQITEAAQTLDHIWFVLDGRARVRRNGESFEIGPKVFVGEIAFLLRRPATADVTLLVGASGVRWRYPTLARLLARNPSMRIAFDRLLNRDLAAKLSA
jgi:hypothetical protein